MTTVTLRLRQSAPAHRPNGDLKFRGNHVEFVHPTGDVVDLDRLSPRARALAEAAAAAQDPARESGDQGVVWMESDRPRREWMRNVEVWCTPEQADQPELRPWRGWAKYPATSDLDPHDYLEGEAGKIPAGWHVYGARPGQPAASKDDTGMTREQVLAFLKEHGRVIKPGTWAAYVARGQAPAPARHVGRTPLWDPAAISDYVQT